jgi:hypothetical protein
MPWLTDIIDAIERVSGVIEDMPLDAFEANSASSPVPACGNVVICSAASVA